LQRGVKAKAAPGCSSVEFFPLERGVTRWIRGAHHHREDAGHLVGELTRKPLLTSLVGAVLIQISGYLFSTCLYSSGVFRSGKLHQDLA